MRYIRVIHLLRGNPLIWYKKDVSHLTWHSPWSCFWQHHHWAIDTHEEQRTSNVNTFLSSLSLPIHNLSHFIIDRLSTPWSPREDSDPAYQKQSCPKTLSCKPRLAIKVEKSSDVAAHFEDSLLVVEKASAGSFFPRDSFLPKTSPKKVHRLKSPGRQWSHLFVRMTGGRSTYRWSWSFSGNSRISSVRNVMENPLTRAGLKAHVRAAWRQS